MINKQKAFERAMKKYDTYAYYQYIYKLVSFLNVFLQLILLVIAWELNLFWYEVLVAFFIAYFLTDFINGLVHMYMDNNDNYDAKWGAFIATFHLHHKIEKYKDTNLFIVYFNESGAKFWLVPYLLIVVCLSFLEINTLVLFILILIGILSSVAEVSHYLCHNGSSKLVLFLQKIRILLPMIHHKEHHEKDNVAYAFLNGSSDFLINSIAKKIYNGYQNGTDSHFEGYVGKGTKNREEA